MSKPTLPSLNSVVTCLSDYDPESLKVDQALQIVKDFVRPSAETLTIETVEIYQSLGRVLAKDIISPINVPASDNSAMDGYAFAGRSISTTDKTSLKVIGKGFAGNAFSGNVNAGECVRIMTGAIMPSGCDTVIPQELVQIDGDDIHFSSTSVKSGDNRRLLGEDLKEGSPALLTGKIVRPSDLGLIASLGIGKVDVKRRLRVGFFSTGDELRSIGEALDPGCVYDSNRYTLFGMLSRLGVEIVDFGVVRDQPEAMRHAFSEAAAQCDAVITSGGVSVGEADYTKQIMRELGDIAFWKIAMRPGRPMAFGSIQSKDHQAVLFGLPGNPVAVMVTFYQFVRYALLAMSGANELAPMTIKAQAQESIRKRPGRTEFQRGIITSNGSGINTVSITGAQGSGVLRSMSEANCFIVLEHDQGNIAAGELVNVVLFEGLL
ncbi:MAG: Molybdopterin biosynthesis protein [Pseudomonadota bacterium]|jgi:molybdopterin molybdotransferase